MQKSGGSSASANGENPDDSIKMPQDTSSVESEKVNLPPELLVYDYNDF